MIHSVVVVQSLSCIWLWPHRRQVLQSSTISQSLLKFMSIKSVMLLYYLILCHPVLLLPSIFPSIRVFTDELALHIRWPKYWSFSFSISPSKEYSGLIFFRIDWFDLLAVQGSVRLCLGKMRLNWSPVWQAGWSHVNFAEQNCIYQNSLHWIIPA